MLEAVIFVIFPFCMVFSAISDTLSMKIANTVPLILTATFLLVAPFTGMPLDQIGWHLLAGMLVLSVTFVLFAVGGMGGGDAKLLAATAVWMGFGMPLLDYLTTTAVFGGLLTLAILAFRGSPLHIYAGSNMFLRNFGSDTKGVPYGIALGAAGLVAFASSPLAIWAMQRVTS